MKNYFLSILCLFILSAQAQTYTPSKENIKARTSFQDNKQRTDRLVELNVIEQVHDLGKTSIVQNAWKREQPLHIHGWVYDVKDGIIKDLDVNFKGTSDLHSVFHLD